MDREKWLLMKELCSSMLVDLYRQSTRSEFVGKVAIE